MINGVETVNKLIKVLLLMVLAINCLTNRKVGNRSCHLVATRENIGTFNIINNRDNILKNI